MMLKLVDCMSMCNCSRSPDVDDTCGRVRRRGTTGVETPRCFVLWGEHSREDINTPEALV